MDVIVIVLLALGLYLFIGKMGDKGKKKAERIGMRANRRD